jgi:hypothetical protein
MEGTHVADKSCLHGARIRARERDGVFEVDVEAAA